MARGSCDGSDDNRQAQLQDFADHERGDGGSETAKGKESVSLCDKLKPTKYARSAIRKYYKMTDGLRMVVRSLKQRNGWRRA